MLGLQPLGFVANDYALATYGLERVTDPAALFSADILEDEFVDWVERSHLLKRAFREVAVIGGLVERQHPGKRKTGHWSLFCDESLASFDALAVVEPYIYEDLDTGEPACPIERNWQLFVLRFGKFKEC